MIGRREFITLLGGAAAWPVAASAQQPGMPVVGFLRSTTAASAAHLVAAFRQGLNETGFVEGQSVAIDFRWADNQNDRLPGLVAEMIRRRVAVIAAGGIAATKAAKAANNTPIVFAVGADPVRIGIVSSLNRPGGNVTGISFISGTDLVAKRLELLHELVPKAMAIAVLLDATGETQLEDVEAAARAVGRQVVIATVASERDFNAAFGQFVNAGAGALLAPGGAVTTGQHRQIAALAIRHAIPALYTLREFVEVGGLMSYGPSQIHAYRRAGIYAGRILKGEKAGDLPVELPTKYELVINLATAKAIGLEIPSTLLARADEVYAARPRRRGDRVRRRELIATWRRGSRMAGRRTRASVTGEANRRARHRQSRRTVISEAASRGFARTRLRCEHALHSTMAW
jgi:putative tryptophan/tyrosine transport system substrate-binding protein